MNALGKILVGLAAVIVAIPLIGLFFGSSHQRTVKDSDLDGIPDAVESSTDPAVMKAYPNANPMHRDMFLSVYLEPNAVSLNASLAASITEYFREAPIINPDGGRGVEVHWELHVLPEPWSRFVNRTATKPGDYHIAVVHQDKFCVQLRGKCAAGRATSIPPFVTLAATRWPDIAGANMTLARDSQQRLMRAALMHELEHVMWWHLPDQFRTSPENRVHTNIPGDALCEPADAARVGDDYVPECDLTPSSFDRWKYASAFWLQKSQYSLLAPDSILHEGAVT